MAEPEPNGSDIVVRTSLPKWANELAKMGGYGAIAFYLIWFVTHSMQGMLERDQALERQTQDVMQQMAESMQYHQSSSEEGIQRLLQTSLVICSNTATDAVQRRACFDDDLAKRLQDYFKQIK